MNRRKSLIDDPTPREAHTAVKQLDKVISEVTLYSPTTAQKQAKARMLIALEENPIKAVGELTCAEASKLARYGFQKYWTVPGFQDWLLCRSEFKERVEYLKYIAMDAAEEILLSDDPKLASARVTLIKAVAVMGNEMPDKKDSNNLVDDFIQKMNKHELQQYIEKHVAQLPAAKVIDAEEIEPNE